MVQKFHSQVGQDRWVIEEVFRGLRGGYFVECGASDGETFSNTLCLERDFGWRGICIEPGAQFEQLRERRSCVCVNACLGDQAHAGRLVDLIVEGSDLSVQMLGRVDYGGTIASANGATRRTPVMCRTLEDVLAENASPEVIDYFSLDTEGSELAILSDFRFDRYRFRALTVEHNAYQGAPQVAIRAKLRALLAANGYVLVREVGYAPDDPATAMEDWYVHHTQARPSAV